MKQQKCKFCGFKLQDENHAEGLNAWTKNECIGCHEEMYWEYKLATV